MSALNMTPQPGQCAAMIEEVDLNGNGTIELGEFIDMMQNRRAAGPTDSTGPADAAGSAGPAGESSYHAVTIVGEEGEGAEISGTAKTDTEVSSPWGAASMAKVVEVQAQVARAESERKRRTSVFGILGGGPRKQPMGRPGRRDSMGIDTQINSTPFSTSSPSDKKATSSSSPFSNGSSFARRMTSLGSALNANVSSMGAQPMHTRCVRAPPHPPPTPRSPAHPPPVTRHLYSPTRLPAHPLT